MNLLDRALAEVAPPVTDDARPELTPPSDREPPPRRGLCRMPQDTRQYGTLTVADGIAMIESEVAAYLANPAPDHVLLIAAPAGLGKSTLGVKTAETWAAGGGRVMYLGPRRDFWDDLQPMMQHPAWWYPWQPRSLGKGQGIGQTCRHAPQMEAWLRRGYTAMAFCANSRICGYSYIENGCPWHAQARNAPPIVFGQYEHLISHPLADQTSLIIGDELPLRAIMKPWHIPAESVVPRDMPDGPRRDLMIALRSLAATAAQPINGRALRDAIGGTVAIMAACEGLTEAEISPPDLTSPHAAEDAPWGHVVTTLLLLRDLTEAIDAGQTRINPDTQREDVVIRVAVTSEGLTLYRRGVPSRLPPHVVWLDATGSADVYRAVFDRPVRVVKPDVQMAGRVYQVWASLNTKSYLEQGDPTPEEPTPKMAHLEAQINHILDSRGYEKPALITYQAAIEKLKQRMGGRFAWFHGSRGTNRLQDCDALIVVGTPQPPVSELVATATMLHDQRREPWATEWGVSDRQYAGTAYGYPISGFWHDAELQAVLSQYREAELIQAIHRARPLRRSVDVWLLTSLPLPDVPVELISLHDLFGAPAGVDPYRWPPIARAICTAIATNGYASTADLVAIGVSPVMARRYIVAYANQHGYGVGSAPASGRGKPPLATGPDVKRLETE